MSNWNSLWKNHSFYSTHDVVLKEDGISRMLMYALKDSKPKQSLIELGAGGGVRSIPVSKRLSLRLYLLDRLKSAEKIARIRSERIGKPFDFIRADALKTGIESNSFNYTMSNGLNEHFDGKQRQEIFDEMARITKKGGKVIVIMPNRWSCMRIQQIIDTRLNRWLFGWAEFFTFWELKEKMKSAGLKNVKLYGVSYATSWIRLVPLDLQRKMYKTWFWKIAIRFPFNFSISNPLNILFGEEIMAVGEK